MTLSTAVSVELSNWRLHSVAVRCCCFFLQRKFCAVLHHCQRSNLVILLIVVASRFVGLGVLKPDAAHSHYRKDCTGDGGVDSFLRPFIFEQVSCVTYSPFCLCSAWFFSKSFGSCERLSVQWVVLSFSLSYLFCDCKITRFSFFVFAFLFSSWNVSPWGLLLFWYNCWHNYVAILIIVRSV